MRKVQLEKLIKLISYIGIDDVDDKYGELRDKIFALYDEASNKCNCEHLAFRSGVTANKEE